MHIIQFKLEFRLEIFLLGVTMICRDNLQDNTVSPRDPPDPTQPAATVHLTMPSITVHRRGLNHLWMHF